jgi:4-amino-4-deoxy-L-arabinose transferase-like glycosyltransferase
MSAVFSCKQKNSDSVSLHFFRITNGSYFSVSTVATISCLLVIGLGLRIHNLGMLGLIVDEGHQALAVNGILQHGYPVVPSGIPYAWNILYIYMQSFAALLFGVNEFSLRLPGVVFSVASIPMIYLFGRSLFNSKVGLLSAFLITFSVWEIEVSRYARAYAAYQFFYILSLFTFYKGFIKGEKLHRFLVPPIFILTYMLTPLGVTLLMAFIVPFFIDAYKPRKKLLVLF